MDGFGIPTDLKKSAITPETAPNLSQIFKNYPTTYLKASGEAVGLPEGQMGNSEVGHTNIGAGRVVYQELTRISKSIKDGSFFENAVLKRVMQKVKNNHTALHLIGLLSDGGVHSHQDHLFALLSMAKKFGINDVYIHAFLDGRDTSPTSGENFIANCQAKLKEFGIGKIATLMGRYYAMDRDNRWERTKFAYDTIVSEDGIFFENDPIQVLKKSYTNDIFDEFIKPTICDKHGTVRDGDSIIFFNFRPDRARQLTRAFVDKNFTEFNRGKFLPNLNFVCMTQYGENISNIEVAFEPEETKDTLGEIVARHNLTQLRIAETEKYAHVTFFFNGGVDKKFSGEDRILIPSPKVATYDLKPEMSAAELTTIVKDKIRNKSHDVIILNFANCDMVGHTGNFDATKIAVQTVDRCVNEIVNEILKVAGVAIITADHGNAEQMLDNNGNPFTAHTTNLVPFCVIGHNCNLTRVEKLSDIVSTMLGILEIKRE